MPTPSQDKIKTLSELTAILDTLRARNQKIVHCHGVFDLLHVGHIKHFQAARELGDLLVVTVTPDRFVKKGPHRPAFPERLRAEAIASLACVDYVAINEWPTAVDTIRLLKPDLFVKGRVKEKGKRDHTDAIVLEEEAAKAVGGRLVLTDEETFSATTLINQFLNAFSPEAQAFLADFRTRYDDQSIVDVIESTRNLSVLTIGESIIDAYQFCAAMAKATKDPHLVARYLHEEKYTGGILAIANHVSNVCNEVGLLTMLGDQDSHEQFIRDHLHQNVQPHFCTMHGAPTIVKRRFVEEYFNVKMFEVYSMRNEDLSEGDEDAFCRALEETVPQYDVVIVADYGHGLMTDRAISIVCDKARFLAVNAQTNAGNRGFNMISKYPRADFVSIGENEIRLETRKLKADLRELIATTARKLSCSRFIVTRGSHGCVGYDAAHGFVEVPSFSVKVLDRIGAGDAVLSVVSPCAKLDVPMEVICFIANVVGAEACAIMGNRSSIDPASLFRHVTSLLK